jgi:hypothetical protein
VVSLWFFLDFIEIKHNIHLTNDDLELPFTKYSHPQIVYEEEDIKKIHFSGEKRYYASNLKQIYTNLNRIKVNSIQYINNL